MFRSEFLSVAKTTGTVLRLKYLWSRFGSITFGSYQTMSHVTTYITCHNIGSVMHQRVLPWPQESRDIKVCLFAWNFKLVGIFLKDKYRQPKNKWLTSGRGDRGWRTKEHRESSKLYQLHQAFPWRAAQRGQPLASLQFKLKGALQR